MDVDLRRRIGGLLQQHRLLTIATNRMDGWPQATTVAYVNEDLTLYCFVSRLSQKFGNIRRDPRISVAIAGEFTNPHAIRGLSVAARATAIDDRETYHRIWRLFAACFPAYADWPEPTPALSVLLRISPVIVSVVDYAEGFGHSELVNVTAQDLVPTPHNHNWFSRKT